MEKSARVLKKGDGEFAGQKEVLHDRFMVNAADAGGAFALVEHLLPPRVLAAPLHRHTREDEYSFILEGRLGALLGEEEIFAEAGDLVFKPRGQWHTFWNAGDQPVRLLELISPGGFEQAFRDIGEIGDQMTPEQLATIAERYGIDVDFEGTMPVMERHGLTMGV
jgi:mannose-6-phosphate isomerase-like protein (cupin superfamily)